MRDQDMAKGIERYSGANELDGRAIAAINDVSGTVDENHLRRWNTALSRTRPTPGTQQDEACSRRWRIRCIRSPELPDSQPKTCATEEYELTPRTPLHHLHIMQRLVPDSPAQQFSSSFSGKTVFSARLVSRTAIHRERVPNVARTQIRNSGSPLFRDVNASFLAGDSARFILGRSSKLAAAVVVGTSRPFARAAKLRRLSQSAR